MRVYTMVDNIRIDKEISDFLDAEKLVKRETYKSVIKRMIARLKLQNRRR